MSMFSQFDASKSGGNPLTELQKSLLSGFVGFGLTGKNFVECIEEVKAIYKKDRYISKADLNIIKSFLGLHDMVENFDVTENNHEIFHLLFLELIEDGDLKIVNAFLKNKSINPSYIRYYGANPPDQITALSKAAYYGHAELVKIFLKLNVDCNTVNTSYTPFIWAVRNGHLEVVKAFLEEKNFNDLITNENDHEKLQGALIQFRCTNYTSPIKQQEKNKKGREIIAIIQKSQEASDWKMETVSTHYSF